MKAMIDNTIPKKNNASPICKVGAPFGNKNAHKTIQNNSDELNSENNHENNSNNYNELIIENNQNNYENNQNNLQKMLNVNGNENDNENDNENGDGNENDQKQPQPFLIKKIQEEAEKLGIILDTNRATIAAASRIDPSWLEGPFNFPEFVNEQLSENPKYWDKPSHEKVLLFSAAFTWENLRYEYPEWRRRKEKAAWSAKVAALKRNFPEICKCGGKLSVYKDGELYCIKCGDVTCCFNETSMEWEWRYKDETENN
jgi:hypothetical protein